MKRQPKTKTVKARALTDPKPAFVSLVKAGANQRPFRAVKQDGTSEQTEKETTMTKRIKADIGFDIAALSFSLTAFPTEASVKAWLDEGGYTDFTITPEADGFSVKNDTVEFEDGTIEKVDGVVEGLTAYVGKIKVAVEAEKSDEEKVAEAAEANPSVVQPVATKSDDTAAPEAAAEPAAEVAGEETAKEEATADTAPAAEGEQVSPAAEEPAADPLAAARAGLKSVEDLCAELTAQNAKKGMYEVNGLAEIARAIMWMIEDAEYGDSLDEGDVSTLKSAGASLVQIMGKVMSKTAVEYEKKFRNAVDPAPAETTAKDEGAGDAPASEEPAVEASAVEPVGEAVAEPTELDVLKAQIAELTARLDGMSQTTTAEKSDAEERVEKADTASQTRKGSDATDPVKEVVKPTATTKSESQMAAERLRRALGVTFQPHYRD